MCDFCGRSVVYAPSELSPYIPAKRVTLKHDGTDGTGRPTLVRLSKMTGQATGHYTHV